MNEKSNTMSQSERMAGCLLGAATGDAIGLPFEGLSPGRISRFVSKPLRPCLVFGRSMVSDDTDHTLFVAQSLLRSSGKSDQFRRLLAWRLRLWLLCLPAGIGFATLRSIIRLWLGFRPSGVYSAGNGPSMRSAVIGAFYSDNPAARQAFVAASTELTHTDPKALTGARAVAEIAAMIVSGQWAARPSALQLEEILKSLSAEPAWQGVVEEIRKACAEDVPLSEVALRFGSGRGISGYVFHSVPFAIVAWHRHYGNYRATLEAAVEAGGDTDTVGAIAGALAGAAVGRDGIPAEWLESMVDWPHSVGYMRRIAAALSEEKPGTGVSTRFSPWLFPRGIVFTVIVLTHGFRRLLPPY